MVALYWAPTVDSMSFAVGYAATAPAAVAIAANGTLSSVDEAVQRRLVQYNHLPPLTNSSRLRLFSKAISVMRVNALSPEGGWCHHQMLHSMRFRVVGIAQRWSTPDRMPHRWMWLWDSCYHSMAINNIQLHSAGASEPGYQVGWEYVKSVLDAAGTNRN